jgi:hypothetical protein
MAELTVGSRGVEQGNDVLAIGQPDALGARLRQKTEASSHRHQIRQ